MRVSTSRPSWRAAWWAACAAAALHAHPSSAIDAPKPAAPPAQEPAAREPITPSDQLAFHERLQRAEHTRAFRGLKIDAGVIDALTRGAADEAVRALSARAPQGDHDANIALVRLQHWCNRIVSTRGPSTQEQIAKLPPSLQGERAAKAAGVLVAQAAYRERASVGCRKAQFDYGQIEMQLRDAAAGGHAASAVELAQFVRDPKKRDALLQSAIKQDYAPGLYAAATQQLMAVQRGDTTENVSSIRQYLKQAGRTLPRAKLDLANCMALGCDGHPADALAANAFGLDAARDGEPTAFLSMARMPWGGRMSRTQHLAWQYFGDRLNEAGCFGEAYAPTAAAFAQTIAMLEKNQDAQMLSTAKAQAEDLWRDNGARAMKEQGCFSAVTQ